MIDLTRDLDRGEDVPLVTVTTDDPDPSYLRIAVLNRFNDNEWSPGDRERRRATRRRRRDAAGPGPVSTRAAHGVRLRRRRSPTTSTPPGCRPQSPVTRVDAAGDWRYDATTMDFLGRQRRPEHRRAALLDDGRRSSTSRPSAMADCQRRRPAGQRHRSPTCRATCRPRRRRPGARGDRRTRRPGSRRRSRCRTGSATTAASRYTLDRRRAATAATTWSSSCPTRANGGRTGYCEQFAAAMAVMARDARHPGPGGGRLPQPDPDRPATTYVYSAHDLHAWPELYFAGSGWVRFEPTPGPAGRQRRAGVHRVSQPFPSVTDELRRRPARPRATGSRPRLTSHPRGRTRRTSRPTYRLRVPVAGGPGGVLVLAVLGWPWCCVPRARSGAAPRAPARPAGPRTAWSELRDTARRPRPRLAGGPVAPRDRVAAWCAASAPGRTRPTPIGRPRHGADTGAGGRARARPDRARPSSSGRYARAAAPTRRRPGRADVRDLRRRRSAGGARGAPRRAEWLAAVAVRPPLAVRRTRGGADREPEEVPAAAWSTTSAETRAPADRSVTFVSRDASRRPRGRLSRPGDRSPDRERGRHELRQPPCSRRRRQRSSMRSMKEPARAAARTSGGTRPGAAAVDDGEAARVRAERGSGVAGACAGRGSRSGRWWPRPA